MATRQSPANQRPSKSSHPAGHFRDKTKYNNRNGRFAVGRGDGQQGQQGQQQEQGGRMERQEAPAPISQEQLTEHLTAKLRGNKFVEVKTKEIKNDRGTLYEIDVINPGLYRIGNGTFFTMKLHTVSHKSRIIFIRIIFNDDEARNADMRINADAIIQIFREIAPDTIESVSITDVDDSKGNKHLAVLASTVKGASLNFTYERAMEFVHVVDEKYGSSTDGTATSTTTTGGATGATASGDDSTDLNDDQIDAETALLEKKLQALKELKQAKAAGQSSGDGESTASTTSTEATQTQAQKPTRKPPSRVSITFGGKTRVITNGGSKP